VAVTAFHIDQFGVSQVLGVGGGQVFSSALIVFLQLYVKKRSFACKNAFVNVFYIFTYIKIFKQSL